MTDVESLRRRAKKFAQEKAHGATKDFLRDGKIPRGNRAYYEAHDAAYYEAFLKELLRLTAHGELVERP